MYFFRNSHKSDKAHSKVHKSYKQDCRSSNLFNDQDRSNIGSIKKISNELRRNSLSSESGYVRYNF